MQFTDDANVSLSTEHKIGMSQNIFGLSEGKIGTSSRCTSRCLPQMENCKWMAVYPWWRPKPDLMKKNNLFLKVKKSQIINFSC